jgi:uncharacterized membrane-anchored protein
MGRRGYFALEPRHLAEVDERVAELCRRIALQQDLVRSMALRGEPTGAAADVLETMQDKLEQLQLWRNFVHSVLDAV